ncbi:MAG: disulfide bond formation protein B [Candidatus Nanopelagicales bacterium]
MTKTFPKLLFWGMHAWVFAYIGVLLGAFTIQFAEGEFPCPLCMLQRYGMILSTLGALWVIMQARRGELTPARYAQGLGLGVLGAAAGALVSVRQILLHIKPGDPGYGSPVMGYHLYTWALITFYVVILFVAAVSILAPVGIPEAPDSKAALTVSSVVVWLFVILVAANVIAIIFLEGFALVLPDDPDSYNLITQLTGG